MLLLLLHMGGCRCISNLHRFSVWFLMTATCKCKQLEGPNTGRCEWRLAPIETGCYCSDPPSGPHHSWLNFTQHNKHNIAPLLDRMVCFCWTGAVPSIKSVGFSCNLIFRTLERKHTKSEDKICVTLMFWSHFSVKAPACTTKLTPLAHLYLAERHLVYFSSDVRIYFTTLKTI